ncbi:MAG: ABC transporter ATP-binding protein [Chloroflexi bacterium]|nr:ABC transporter ATP-binding protein [Chloroflexota bacterium]
MLTLNDIHTYYGDSYILQGVSLQVNPGEVVCLLGRNGAGKTTTIRSIIGFSPPRAGKIIFNTREITRLPAHRIARAGIGLVPQGRGVFPTLTVRENLLLAARNPASFDSRSGRGWDLNAVYAQLPRLREREHHHGNELSGGEQQMLAIGRALMTNPELLLMDEPTEGLAPLIVREIARLLLELKRKKQSILLVEQSLPLALELADRIYVMSKGRIVFEGSPRALFENEDVKKQYLGF